ncbi:hypothetical protein ECSTECMHI813_1373 [Escherichia coli STEC_MHI813]|nr:hypothetical protein ECSTECMHI813_1373 [Escherichia coli STEC_MHI813]
MKEALNTLKDLSSIRKLAINKYFTGDFGLLLQIRNEEL